MHCPDHSTYLISPKKRRKRRVYEVVQPRREFVLRRPRFHTSSRPQNGELDLNKFVWTLTKESFRGMKFPLCFYISVDILLKTMTVLLFSVRLFSVTSFLSRYCWMVNHDNTFPVLLFFLFIPCLLFAPNLKALVSKIEVTTDCWGTRQVEIRNSIFQPMSRPKFRAALVVWNFVRRSARASWIKPNKMGCVPHFSREFRTSWHRQDHFFHEKVLSSPEKKQIEGPHLFSFAIAEFRIKPVKILLKNWGNGRARSIIFLIAPPGSRKKWRSKMTPKNDTQKYHEAKGSV